jgi:hypothetical protein
MKMPIAILLANSPQGSGANDPTISDPLRVAARSGSFLSERPNYSLARQYKERERPGFARNDGQVGDRP